MTERKVKSLKKEPPRKKLPVLKPEDKKEAKLPKGVDYALYAQPLSFWYKVGQLWWIVPKSYILRSLEIRKKQVSIVMWNGNHYEFGADDFEAKYEIDRNHLRRLDINLKTGEKIKIKEMLPMYPNWREDFDDLITIFGAEKGRWTKVGMKFYEIAKGLKELSE